MYIIKLFQARIRERNNKLYCTLGYGHSLKIWKSRQVAIIVGQILAWESVEGNSSGIVGTGEPQIPGQLQQAAIIMIIQRIQSIHPWMCNVFLGENVSRKSLKYGKSFAGLFWLLSLDFIVNHLEKIRARNEESFNFWILKEEGWLMDYTEKTVYVPLDV